MPRTTRSGNRPAAALRTSSFDSDLTDLDEVETSLKRSGMTKRVRVNNADRGEDPDSRLSRQDVYLAAEHEMHDVYEEEYEEMGSEEDDRAYSAYHGSDSEVSDSNLETKHPRRVKKDPRVELVNPKEKGDDSNLHSDTEGDDIEIPDVMTLTGKTHVLALIDEHRSQVEAQMKKVNMARNALRVEEKQHGHIQRRLDRLYSSIAPFHQLPYELIGEIASLCVEEGHSPWQLVKICRAWRAACFGTPRLWSRLRIMLSPKSSLTTRYHEAKENCISVKQFDQAMQRSGAAPLHLEFSDSQCYGRCWHLKAQKNQPIIDHMTEVLSSPQQTARVKSLSVGIDYRTHKCTINDHFFTGPFPALEYISLIRTAAASTLNTKRSINATWAPRLHSAEFMGINLGDVNKLKWIEHLTKLTIDSKGYSWGTSEYYDTLDRTKSLTTLTLVGIRRTRHNSTRIVELPCLRVMEIRASALRWTTFKTPVLEKLAVQKTEWVSCRIIGPSIAPLKEVHWAGLQKDYILSSIDAQSVDLLSVDFRNGGGSRMTSAWNGGTLYLHNCCFPDKLHIKHSGVMPKDNELQNGNFLRMLPNVKEVRMMNIGIGKPFLKELAKKTNRADGNSAVLKRHPLCPRVEVVELDMTHVDRKDRQAYKTLVRAVVKARGLRSMKCTWDEGGEWEEFSSWSTIALE